jgi:hypothetical protein
VNDETDPKTVLRTTGKTFTQGYDEGYRDAMESPTVLKLLAVVEASDRLVTEYPQSKMHEERGTEGKCNWCGQPWPCASRNLSAALEALNE